MDYSILTQYIHPELFVLVIVLYFLGLAVKKTEHVKDELIPFVLGAISIVLCAIYILSVNDTPKNYHEVLSLIFDIVVQGILNAAASVYFNQIYKQMSKKTGLADIVEELTDNGEKEDK